MSADAGAVPVSVLVIDDRVPDPAFGAGFGRMLQSLAALRGAGFEVTLAPVIPGAATPALDAHGVQVAARPVAEHLAEGARRYDVVVVSRPHNWVFADEARGSHPEAAVVYDGEALFFRRTERQAELAGDGERAASLRAQAATEHAVEARIAREADAIVAISAEEADWFRAQGAAVVRVDVPIVAGVQPTTTAFRDRRDALFVAGWGSGADSPNGDGLRWLVSEVFPPLRAAEAWVRVRVTGGAPPSPLGALECANLAFVGQVDLEQEYARARVVVVPVRYGSGVKIKVVEALAYGVPVVTTATGAEGLPPEWSELVTVADAPGSFADATLQLLHDRQVWEAQRAAMVPLPALEPRSDRASLAEVVDYVTSKPKESS